MGLGSIAANGGEDMSETTVDVATPRGVLRTAGLRPLLAALAERSRLPAWNGWPASVWLEALVLQESGGNPNAVRYEPALDRRRGPGVADRPGVDDGWQEDDKSYGLMQVLGSNVRRLSGLPPGTPMDYTFLTDPVVGLAFGLRVLRAELDATGGDVARALARYNGGPSGERKSADGTMRCQAYVDGVRSWVARVVADR
jgi:soluble lytic murein transglycosylase-like protein